MDIVRAFSDSGLAHGVTINIQGTMEEPLFQANQIGVLLGLANIRDAIKDFDSDEKGVVSTDTPGGAQSTLFLTELGLIRLLNMSRKPFARPFQKWVAKVIKEIRLTGKYELENRLALAAKEKDDVVAALAARDAAP
jgi:prophage antirepressor-like protein